MIGKEENILFFMKISLKFLTTKEKPGVKCWYLVTKESKPHYHVH